ncbi:MAG: nuclear transport factor 2 family protein [Sphingomonas taxi]
MSLVVALALAAASPDTVALGQLVDRFNAARADFADTALAATLAPDFEEISPVGDVDDRAKVIGFYRPADRKPAPVLQGSERSIALHGTWALVTERLSFAMPRPDGTTLTRSLRVRYVAVKAPGGWQLASAQYTGIPAR